MNTPTVDVVVPTYNQANYLQMALRSLVGQRFQDWRALVIDNFSTDDTRQVVAAINDPRISIVQFANNGVIAASRNIGIRESTAEFIAFLDSDDWWLPEKLDRCINELRHSCDLVCHAEEWRSESSMRVVNYGPESRSTYRSLLIRGNRLSTSAVVGKATMFKAVGGFSEEPSFVTAEDYELWMRLAQANYSFRFISDVLGVYRIHPESASSATQRHLLAELSVINTHFDQSSFSVLLRRHRQSLAYYTAARSEQRAKRFGGAARRFFEAWYRSPLQLRIYPAFLLLLIAYVRGRVVDGKQA
jgi:glycosyltransferase involved in cell wall biosynthesis